MQAIKLGATEGAALQMLSRGGHLAPWAAQWMPNALVGLCGLVLMKWGVRR